MSRSRRVSRVRGSRESATTRGPRAARPMKTPGPHAVPSARAHALSTLRGTPGDTTHAMWSVLWSARSRAQRATQRSTSAREGVAENASRVPARDPMRPSIPRRRSAGPAPGFGANTVSA